MKTAVYPGSFDPFTFGHFDIACRALDTLDNVIILIANNETKKSLFTEEEKFNIIVSYFDLSNELKFSLGVDTNIRIHIFNGLLIDYVEEQSIEEPIIVKGLRSSSDFEYEKIMANTNYEISSNTLETIIFMANPSMDIISSSAVRTLASNGYRDLSPTFVNEYTNEKLKEKFKKGEINGK